MKVIIISLLLAVLPAGIAAAEEETVNWEGGGVVCPSGWYPEAAVSSEYASENPVRCLSFDPCIWRDGDAYGTTLWNVAVCNPFAEPGEDVPDFVLEQGKWVIENPVTPPLGYTSDSYDPIPEEAVIYDGVNSLFIDVGPLLEPAIATTTH